MKRILFVCMGNICRSPAGEGVMQHLVNERGLAESIEVDSAGTIGYHTGDPADRRMMMAAERRGYSLTSRARQVDPKDFERFDLIIAMDNQNLRDLREISRRSEGSAELRLLGDYLPATPGADVPDPYYGGAQGFEEVLNMIEEACPAILDDLTAAS